MMQTDFTWTYSQHAQQQQLEHNQHQSGLLPAAPWTAPAAGFGATELHPLDPGTDRTFHDDVTGLFECDNILFSDIGAHEWPSQAPGGHTGDIILGLAHETGLEGLSVPAPLGAVPAAAFVARAATAVLPAGSPALTLATAVGAPHPKSGIIINALPEAEGATNFLGIQDTCRADLVDPNPSAEASGSGSGDASLDGFTLPDAAPTLGELASPSPVKAPLGIAIAVALHDEGEGSSDNEDELGAPKLGYGHIRGSFSVRPGSGPVGTYHAQHESTGPLSSSGHSGGGRSQPSTSRGQGSTASALGKRTAGELEAAAKRGGRRRVPTRRAAAAAYDDSSDEDEEDDVQYRSVRRAMGISQTAAGGSTGIPARTSTRLQGRPTPYRLDSDYITYDDVDEPPSPTRASGSSGRRGRGRAATGAGAGSGSGRRGAPSRAGRRTVPLAAQRIRATSARHELKGRPSFAEIVEAGFMRPGPHRFNVGNVEVAAAVGDDGAIMYAGTRYRAISKFALVVLRERNPTRQSCDGWKEVAWNGEKLDALRIRVQAHARQQARQRAQ